MRASSVAYSAAALLLLTGCADRSALACGGTVSRPGTRAPVVEGRNVADSSPLRLEPGKVTVVNVWGSWCGPCRVEQPLFNEAAARHPEVDFLGLDVEDNDASARTFQREFGVAYPSISDRSRELATRLGARSTPATFAVGADGTVKAAIQGQLDADILECMIGLARS